MLGDIFTCPGYLHVVLLILTSKLRSLFVVSKVRNARHRCSVPMVIVIFITGKVNHTNSDCCCYY